MRRQSTGTFENRRWRGAVEMPPLIEYINPGLHGGSQVGTVGLGLSTDALRCTPSPATNEVESTARSACRDRRTLSAGNHIDRTSQWLARGVLCTAQFAVVNHIDHPDLNVVGPITQKHPAPTCTAAAPRDRPWTAPGILPPGGHVCR